MTEPNYGAWTQVPGTQTPQDAPPAPAPAPAPSGYISREELEEILAARDRAHAEEMASVKSRLPVAVVPMHSGGPGNDNHQNSWNLAEQEAAARGEILDHWVIRN